jgi:hypothetical protein
MTVKDDSSLQCSFLQRIPKPFNQYHHCSHESRIVRLVVFVSVCPFRMRYLSTSWSLLLTNLCFLESMNIHGNIFSGLNFWHCNNFLDLVVPLPDWTARNMSHLTNFRWREALEVLNANPLFRDLDNDTNQTIHDDAEAHAAIFRGEAEVPSTTFKPPMHLHPQTDIACNNDLSTLTRRAIEASTAFHSRAFTKDNYDKVVSLWTAANSLKLLHRFTHREQSLLLRRPLPDGRNLEDNTVTSFSQTNSNDLVYPLHAAWQYYRQWIRFLHFRTCPSHSLELQKLVPLKHAPTL